MCKHGPGAALLNRLIYLLLLLLAALTHKHRIPQREWGHQEARLLNLYAWIAHHYCLAYMLHCMELHSMGSRVHHDALRGGMFGTNTGCCWACRAELSKGSYLPSQVLPLLAHTDEQSKCHDT